MKPKVLLAFLACAPAFKRLVVFKRGGFNTIPLTNSAGV
jgi:hypothetical protein